ncbi:MAG TPA: hypothetical protein VN725_05400 [Rhodanobacteraceae bacterium]|nr:hypothetical protein [Rhodanobacteraceae bacterium]
MAFVDIPLRRFASRIALGAVIGFGTLTAGLPMARAADAISFSSGSPWSQTIGKVSKDSDFHEYTVAAVAGKTLQINLISRNPNLFFRVLAADSHKPLVDTASSGESTWSTRPASDETYTVRVYEDPDTVSGNEVTKYALQVGVF